MQRDIVAEGAVIALDDVGRTTASISADGLVTIRQRSSMTSQTSTILLTEETIRFLAGRITHN